jgi:8-oxo-dGTP pyrophosphatase MutT (NUDIX family)
MPLRITGDESSKLVLAAGGVIWRRDNGNLKLAIIYRSRYAGEPGLPKGKVEPGELFEDTALREVMEETGCEATLLRFVDATSYMHDGKHKIVFFWNMKLHRESIFRPSEEVERVEWLKVDQAIQTLQHEAERQLVKKAYRDIDTKIPFNITDRLRHLRTQYLTRARRDRLEGSIRSIELEFQRRACASYKDISALTVQDSPIPRQAESNFCWFIAALKLLSESKAASQQGSLDLGWRFLHSACRMEIFALRDAELKVRGETLRFETEKLSGWRQRATAALFRTAESLKTLDREAMYEVALIRDEHYDNQGYKDVLMRQHMLILVSIMSALLGITFLFIYRCYSAHLGLLCDSEGARLASAALFGLLGAAFSAFLRANSISQSARIPETVSAIRVTLMRLLLGAASAIFLYFVIKANILNLFEQSIGKGLTTAPQTLYVISFVAGFTERLVLRAVEQVIGTDKNAK